MKKRIIALALVVVLALSAVSCSFTFGGGDEPAGTGISGKVVAMYARSTPTKSITTVNYNFEGQKLTDTTTLISGKIDGNLEAATLTQITQRLRTVEAGSNAAILPSFVPHPLPGSPLANILCSVTVPRPRISPCATGPQWKRMTLFSSSP